MVCRRASTGQVWRDEIMPLCDRPAELVEHEGAIGRARALEACDRSERERVDGLVTPFPHQAGDDGQPDGLESPIRLQLTVEPLNVARLARKEECPVSGEKDVLVPAREVDRDRRVAEIRERTEAGELRRDEYGPQRLPDDPRTHSTSMPPSPPASATYRRISETPVTPSTDLMPWAGAGWSGQRVFP
jgi:hypothetical protein